MVKVGDTIITTIDEVGVIVQASPFSAANPSNNSGAVVSARMANNPGDCKIFVLEAGGYNFQVTDGEWIKEVKRGTETIFSCNQSTEEPRESR
tara:strand:- start:17 stop:295 length:279 start_codon:yes stop_codon:yes gene_type:complete